MIKINLLKVEPNQIGFGDTEMMGMEPGISKEEQTAAVRNLICIILPLAGLIGYEMYNLDIARTQMLRERAALQKVDQQLLKVTNSLKEFADIEKDAKILEDKITILKSLSKIRLREVKALDFLQSITPGPVWFKLVQYSSSSFVFQGYSMTDAALSKFIKQLESSLYFQEVILKRATEAKDKVRGTIKEFEVSAKPGTFE